MPPAIAPVIERPNSSHMLMNERSSLSNCFRLTISLSAQPKEKKNKAFSPSLKSTIKHDSEDEYEVGENNEDLCAT